MLIERPRRGDRDPRTRRSAPGPAGPGALPGGSAVRYEHGRAAYGALTSVSTGAPFIMAVASTVTAPAGRFA